MTGTQLESAAQLLRRHYGPAEPPGPPGRWSTLVEVVLAGSRSAPVGQTFQSANDPQHAPGRLESPPHEPQATLLSSPSEAAHAAVEEITAALSSVPRGKQLAPLLKRLAAWWLDRFGESDDCDSSTWDGSLDDYREQLRQIRGVGVELADRLLLFVGGLAAYPLDRASIRIASRHGWLGLDAAYEEWQSFFTSSLAHAGVDPREFSLWSYRLGKDFCGPQPRCEQCPLKPLLPPGGPYEPADS